MRRDRASPKIMARRDRHERARVVVKSSEVPVPCSLDDLVKVSCDPGGTVMKPPRRTNAKRRPMPCHGCQFLSFRLLSSKVNAINLKLWEFPTRFKSGVRPSTQLVGRGISAPLSAPNSSKSRVFVLRWLPACTCITKPSSADISAILMSIWPWNARAS